MQHVNKHPCDKNDLKGLEATLRKMRGVKCTPRPGWWRDPSKDRWEWDSWINTIQGCFVINAYRGNPMSDTPPPETSDSRPFTHSPFFPVLISPFFLSHFLTVRNILLLKGKLPNTQWDKVLSEMLGIEYRSWIVLPPARWTQALPNTWRESFLLMWTHLI